MTLLSFTEVCSFGFHISGTAIVGMDAGLRFSQV